MSDNYLRKMFIVIHWLNFFLNICLALKRAVKIRWMDSRRNPTIVLVGLQESGCCSTEVCCDDYLVQPKGWISNVLCYCSPYFVCSVSTVSEILGKRQSSYQSRCQLVFVTVQSRTLLLSTQCGDTTSCKTGYFL